MSVIKNQAAWCRGKGQACKIGPAPRYVPQADEVIICNHAVAINPIDWKLQDSGWSIKTWPTIFGYDVAGVIHEVGEKVTSFQIGDRVIAYSDMLWDGDSRYSAFQLYPVAKTNLMAKIPNHMSFKDACVLPTAIETAAAALFTADDQSLRNTRCSNGTTLRVPPPTSNSQPCGKTIVIWGGSSSVGSAAIQLARSSGVKVVAVASSHNHDLCKQAGASVVVDYNRPTVVSDVVEAVNSIGGKFCGLFDAISSPDVSLLHTPSVVDQLGGGLLITTRAVPDNLPESVEGAMVCGGDHLTNAIWKDFVPTALDNNVLLCLPPACVVGHGLEAIQGAVDECKKGVSGKKIVVMLEPGGCT